MNNTQARQLAEDIKDALQQGNLDLAWSILVPILSERTPFRFLDAIGVRVGESTDEKLYPFLECISISKLEGGWVVIASALGQGYDHDPQNVFDRCKAFIVFADIWYATDIFSERVPGPALVADFDRALKLLSTWRVNSNRWVRRSVGVAAHFWAKRSSGSPQLVNQAGKLLDFLTPMISEWEMDATKGVAWGLKTIGRNYPDLMTEWLVGQVLPGNPKYRSHMLRKATLYLSAGQRDRVNALR